MKTEGYSWRESTDIKSSVERAARRRKVSLSKVLDMAAQEWLKSSGSEADDDETQFRLHKAAAECFGCFGSMASGDTRRSETASATVRQLHHHGQHSLAHFQLQAELPANGVGKRQGAGGFRRS